MDNVELVKTWLSFLSSLAWPAAVLTIALLFRTQLRSLIQRLQSSEIAGARFNFNEAASGFIESRIDELAGQTDASQRAQLAGEIKGVAAVLGSIHPVSLAIMIDSAQGLHAWIGGSYTDKKQYFDDLERAGLATVHTEYSEEANAVEARISFTERGREVIEAIGMAVKS